jgi:hypothetical protein
MSLLLMMGGSDTPNTRSLFANNEAGLALDVGDRYGASESKRTWRRNLLTYSEGTVAQLGVSSNVTDAASTISGFANSIAFADNASQRFAYKVLGLTVGQTHTFSVYMQMDDASIPVPGATTGTGDFSLIVNSSIQSSVSVQLISGSLYRVSASVAGTTTAGTNFGIIKYTGQSNKTFRVTGYQLEQSSTPTEYQPITDFNTEFKAAYPTHSLYQDSNGVTPAVSPGDPVGLILDTARGGLDNLGPELVTTSVPATVLNGTPFLSGASVVAGKAYKVTYSVTENAGSVSASFRVGLSANFISGHTIAAGYTGTRTVYLIATAPGALNLYSDAAGTDLDLSSISVREIPGNHAYQTTSGSRPALARTPDGGRRNLLLYSEDISNVIWVGYQVTKSSTGFLETAATDEHAVSQTLSSGDGSVAFTITAELKGVGGRTWCRVRSRNTGFSATAGGYFELSGAGSVGNTANTNASSVSRTITSIADGWYRIVISGITHNAGHTSGIGVSITSAGGNGTASFTGDITQGLSIRNVQIETGSSATAYQKVGLTSDVTESGKRDCWGLLFDGSDDSLQTASVDFSATDKTTVMAGVRRQSNAAIGILFEMSTNVGSNNGVLVAYTPNDTLEDKILFASKGTTSRFVESNSLGTPSTFIFAGTSDISGDLVGLRVNGVGLTSNTSDQGSGNYGNYPIYIGSRGGSSFRFNGIIYTLIIRGATTPTGTIADFEKNLLRLRAGLGPF